MTPPSAGSSGVAPQGATEPTPEPRGGDASAEQTGSGGRPIPSPTPSPEAGESPPQGFSPQPASAQGSGGVSCASAPEQSSPLALILMLLALPSLIRRLAKRASRAALNAE
jgi:MYXO-CTERM domain-containing protein